MDKPLEQDALGSFVRREPVVSLMFAFSLFLVVFIAVAGAAFARSGHAELLVAALVLTGAFALVGMGFGLMRNLGGRRTVVGK